ncbi:MAG TPA: TIGR02587 family membrane protein [Candidatus Eisenbacteria bacterium]|nr:TIGR02587 family membrane protein [Candidatus Eisenbacteria bacterium]
MKAGLQKHAPRDFLIGLARAFGGAIIFSLPILMTMEMWHLGFAMDTLRLALLLLLTLPLLIGLSHYIGFEETFGFKDDAVDAFVALTVGFAAGAAALGLFGVIGPGMSLRETAGKIAIQAVPGSMGAMLAQGQLGGKSPNDKKRHAGYLGEIFIMAAGALFLAFNVAPTEEIILIAYQMTPWHTIALVFASLGVMHAFVYALEFRGTVPRPPEIPFWSVFLRFTVVGYAVGLLMSFYILWTFGRIDALALPQILSTIAVLGFPAAVGAAAARLIL